MKKYVHIYALLLMVVFNTLCKAQSKTEQPKENITPDSKNASVTYGPNSIVRTVKQDRKGNIWIASWQGVFKYDGKSFTNVTAKVSSARFFSVLEDKKGNFWFSSVGSGVYYYDGKSFRNFTTRDGLASNRVTDIYEDKTGNIWFGTEGGASRYDGKSFRNFTIADGLFNNDVNSIIEDKAGKFWFGTRGSACIYNGKTFTMLMHKGKPFINVRTIIADTKGNIWLGGRDGLWRYDGSTYTNFTTNFVGYIYEDKKGNIWTSLDEKDQRFWNKEGIIATSLGGSFQGTWAVSRYDVKSLYNKKPTAMPIKSKAGMTFGILEAVDGSIWYGSLDGVYRYDGNTTIGFSGAEGK